MLRSSGGYPPRSCQLARSLIGACAAFGLAAFVGASVPGSSGCIIPDYCILVQSPGTDWCRNVAGAVMWPAGDPNAVEPIIGPGGMPPQGCRCFSDAEHQILNDEVPEPAYQQRVDELEVLARQECAALVPPGFDHNCFETATEPASVDIAFGNGAGSCIGSCTYIKPPPGGTCDDLDLPAQCDGGGPGGSGSVEGTGDPAGSSDTIVADSSGGDQGDEESSGAGGLHASDFIECDGSQCQIDAGFARMLYQDPALLLDESTRLRFDAKTRRFELVSVRSGSVAWALGLRSGDRLESIDGHEIDSLDRALSIYAQGAAATSISVRIIRGTQWLDFELSFVP
ncbi:MAG: PDZ domain-containing protein [Myxococcota bacterium]